MIEIEYIEPRKLEFCELCGKLMGSCDHTKYMTFKRVFMSKEEVKKFAKPESENTNE